MLDVFCYLFIQAQMYLGKCKGESPFATNRYRNVLRDTCRILLRGGGCGGDLYHLQIAPQLRTSL